jgi:hypothetical protein
VVVPQDRSKYVFVPRTLGVRLRVTMHLAGWVGRLLNEAVGLGLVSSWQCSTRHHHDPAGPDTLGPPPLNILTDGVGSNTWQSRHGPPPAPQSRVHRRHAHLALPYHSRRRDDAVNPSKRALLYDAVNASKRALLYDAVNPSKRALLYDAVNASKRALLYDAVNASKRALLYHTVDRGSCGPSGRPPWASSRARTRAQSARGPWGNGGTGSQGDGGAGAQLCS